MTKWAHVENNEINGVYDKLPRSWRNISGFEHLESDPVLLESYGWKKIDRYETFDADKYDEMGYTFSIQNGEIVGTPILHEKIEKEPTEEDDLAAIRAQRDILLVQSDIYQLADWQKTFDENLKNRWLVYRAKLRNLPEVYKTTGELIWPNELSSLITDSNIGMISYINTLENNSSEGIPE